MKKITIKEQAYPQALRKINEPPQKLYVKGTIPKGPCFAVVGTRRYSSYGQRAALDIVSELSRAGLVIVSGMARGIDTFAHQACLKEDGKTIAVLGTGIDEKSIYPKDNLELSRAIVSQGGCLLSEQKPGTPGYKSNFLKRNRIISGLCLGVLVIEAKTRSGALSTANWARKQGKKLFALPGSIYALNSRGTNALLKKGAAPVTSAQDVLKKLKIRKLKLNYASNKKKSLSNEEKLVFKKLKQKPLHVEEIIEATGLKAHKVCSILTLMESKGIIKEFGVNSYVINSNHEISNS